MRDAYSRAQIELLFIRIRELERQVQALQALKNRLAKPSLDRYQPVKATP